MKKLYLFLAVLLPASSAFPQNNFQNTFGGPWILSCVSVIPESDSGYTFLVSRDYNQNIGTIARTDERGSVLLTKRYPVDINITNKMIKTFDGGYLISARSVQFQNTYYHQLLKVDNAYNPLWSMRYENGSFNQGSVFQHSDSGLVLFGRSDDNLYVVKTDQLGVPNLTNVYSNSSTTNNISDVKETSDQGFIVAGTYSTGNHYQSFLFKTNSAGAVQWAKNYDSVDPPYFQKVLQTPDGGYLVSGFFWDPTVRTILLKTDSAGNLMWNKIFTNAQAGYLKPINSGDYILAGTTNLRDTSDFVLIKINPVGDTLWTRQYGLNLGDGEMLDDAIQTLDDGFLLSGRTTFTANNGAYIVKTDPDGFVPCNLFQPVIDVLTGTYTVTNISIFAASGFNYLPHTTSILTDAIYDTLTCGSFTGIEDLVSYSWLVIYPNPAGNQVTVSLTNAGELIAPRLLLYDAVGKMVKYFAGDALVSRKQFEVDVTEFSQGVYYLVMVNDNRIAGVEKFVKANE